MVLTVKLAPALRSNRVGEKVYLKNALPVVLLQYPWRQLQVWEQYTLNNYTCSFVAISIEAATRLGKIYTK